MNGRNKNIIKFYQRCYNLYPDKRRSSTEILQQKAEESDIAKIEFLPIPQVKNTRTSYYSTIQR